MAAVRFLIAWSVVAAPVAQAQDPARPDSAEAPPYRLEAIGVTVTRGLLPLDRVPAAVSVVDRDAIQRGRLTLTLAEALAAVPGVAVNNRYTFSLDTRVAIRGFGSRAAFGVRGVRILVDGVPLTMPDGQAALNNLELGAAERIEVIRGPNSALHGNAAGGVIAVESEEPPPVPIHAEGRVLVGDYGTSDRTNLRKAQTKVGGQFDRGTYYASISRMELDGFREHSRAEQTSIIGKARYAVNDRSYLTFVLNAVDVPVAENPGSLPLDSVRRDPALAWPANVRLGAGKTTRQVQAGVGYAHLIGDDRVDLAVHGITRDLENPLPFAVIALDRVAGGARATYRAHASAAGRDLFLTAGVDLEAQRDLRTEFNNDGGRPGSQLRRDQTDRVASIGPFLQGQLALRPGLDVKAGIRFDAVRFRSEDRMFEDGRDDSGERTLRARSPVFGVLYAPRPDVTIYGTVASSFQTPTTTELINAPPAPGDSVGPGGFNNRLEPQKATSYELGIRGAVGRRIRYDVAGYWMRVSDELVPFQLPQVPGREFFRNAGESRHVGLEAGVAARLGHGLSTRAAYTYNDFTFVDDGLPDEDFEGNRLPGVAPHTLFASANYERDGGVFAGLDLRLVDDVFANDANDSDAVAEGYALLDLRIGFDRTIGRLGVQPVIGVNNLLDRRYSGSVVANAAGRRYFEPAPGRNLFLGLTVPYGR